MISRTGHDLTFSNHLFEPKESLIIKIEHQIQLYSANTKVMKVSNAASVYTSRVFDLNHVDLTVWSPYHIKLACL